MHCPKCKAINKFKRDGKAVYCVAKVGNGLCLYTLKANEKKIFNIRRRKEYKRKYYRNKKKYLPGISLKEIAIIKFCNYDTVLKNKNEFDIIPGTKPVRVEFNDKVLKWWPND